MVGKIAVKFELFLENFKFFSDLRVWKFAGMVVFTDLQFLTLFLLLLFDLFISLKGRLHSSLFSLLGLCPACNQYLTLILIILL